MESSFPYGMLILVVPILNNCSAYEEAVLFSSLLCEQGQEAASVLVRRSVGLLWGRLYKLHFVKCGRSSDLQEVRFVGSQ